MIPVFPIVPGEKTPLTAHGFHDASNDPTQLAAWRREHPAANWGMPTGPASGYDVLDLDVPRPEKGKTANGRATFADLEAVHGQVYTPMVATPSGGLHLYFKHRPGTGSGADRLPGIDVRGEGGYVVIPPSSIGGKDYLWLDGIDIQSGQVAEWPDWLWELVKKPERPVAAPRPTPTQPLTGMTPWGRKALSGLLDEMAGLQPGSRDDRRNKICFRIGRIVAGGNIDYDVAVSAMLQGCQSNGLAEDLGERELLKRVEKGIESGIQAGPVGPDTADGWQTDAPPKSAPPAKPAIASAQAPPSDIDAESALLAAMLKDPTQMDRVTSLRPDDFYVARHRALFDLMRRHHEDHGTIDVVTLRAAMPAGLLRDLDDGAYLDTLLGSTANPGQARRYAEIVTERAKQRAMLTLAYDLDRAAREHQDPRVILEMARERLAGVERQGGKDPVTVESLLEDAFAEIASSTRNDGISTGFTALDGILGGFEAGQMIVLGGRPSMGKSALALNIALRVAGSGIPVGYLSYEMTRVQLVRRALACYAGLATNRLKGGALLDEAEIDRLNEARTILKHSPLVLDDTEGCSPEAMRARCRRLVQKHGAGLLVVDHLHLMRPPERDRTIRSATDSMTLISHAVKAMAVELGVPVLALAQLNREAAKANREVSTKRRKKWDEDGPDIARPTLTDLRDSGALEQDADVVALIHRDGYYTKVQDTVANVIVAKNRDGETGTISLGWSGACQRFDNLSV